jgi:hypothetical protein
LNYELTDIPLKFAKVNVEEQDGMETVRRLILSHLDKFPPGLFHLAVNESDISLNDGKEKQRAVNVRKLSHYLNHTKTAGDRHFGVKNAAP